MLVIPERYHPRSRCWKRTCSGRPAAVDSAVLLGHAYRARGDREAARRACGEALRRAPRKSMEELTSFAEAIVASWRRRAEQALAELDHDGEAKPR